MSADGESATADATLTEGAVLRDSGAPRRRDADAYESTYRARYELQRAPGGAPGARGWRIVSGTVLY